MKAIALTSLILFLTTAYSDAFEVIPPLPDATASVALEPAGRINSPLRLAISCTDRMVAQYKFSILGLGVNGREDMQNLKFVLFEFQIDEGGVSSPELRVERYLGDIVLSTYEIYPRSASYPVKGLKQVQGGMEMRDFYGKSFLYGAEDLAAGMGYLERKCEDLSFSSQLAKAETPADLQKHGLVPLHFYMGGYYKLKDEGDEERNEGGEVFMVFREVGIGNWTSIERARSLTSLAKLINSTLPEVDIELTLLAGGTDRMAAMVTSSVLTYSAKSDTLVVEGNDFQIGEDFYLLLQKYVESDLMWPGVFRNQEKRELIFNQYREEYGRDPEQINDYAIQELKTKEINLSMGDAPVPFTYKLVLQDARMALCDDFVSLCF
ncbi:hypothetical protein PSE_3017 [Pseudovibrio sp. FO-BEG1]|uniref:hypothetical protein n=1 Tax=Pseudovibrio sp. (strain FO-BEG1) TaxID=911045 RepID=UPI000238D1DE|nr:hypothetical protein [Pseudovibrio sp. FO-BEG1]AEV37525.1 hypothetical protein PSE_3017 [Pseudovibrio sp. FO-BEG1]